MAITDNKDLVLPKDSLILVTGASGYIASNIVKEALDLGYRVRGTARSEEKANHTKSIFDSPHYETAIVPDMQPESAFDNAVKGVDAVIHVASITTFSPDPHEVVPPTVQAAIGILKSALKEPKVKRFVFTSSSVALTLPKPGKKFCIDKTMWNDEVEHFADVQPPYTQDMSFGVYSVSKLRAEQEVWKFVKENNPAFVVNTVLPNFNMGRIIRDGGVTGGMIQSAFKGDVNWDFPPQYMINVIDDARIHIAAAIDGSVANERIIAFDAPFNWNDVLALFREFRPDVNFPDTKPDEERDLSEVDNALGAELLKKWWGQEGYTGLKESIRQNIEGM